MTMRITCPNGHRLKVKEELAGKLASCPKCRATVTIPAPPAYQISDTSVLAVLGDCDASRSVIARPTAAPPPERRACTRCGGMISAAVHVCPLCRTYLGGASFGT